MMREDGSSSLRKLMCCRMVNNIVDLFGGCCSQMRHCRLVFGRADVLMMATRWLGVDYSSRLEIVMNLLCMGDSTMSQR
jgi:hypothetical protein